MILSFDYFSLAKKREKISMFFLSFLALTSLLLCASCGRDYSVKPKPNPHKKKLFMHKEPVDTTKMTGKEKHKYERAQIIRRCALLRKKPADMTADELKEAKEISLSYDDKEHAITYLERLIVVENNLNDLKDLRLELADMYFEDGKLEKAETSYNDFTNLYPGSEAVEYAEYKAILSSFYQTLTADFDQSKTHQTIKLSQDFLDKKKYKQYAIDVASVQKECQTTLFNSEVNIINFYLGRNKLTSAEHRLAQLKEKFSYLDTATPVVLTLECELAKKQGKPELALEKQKSLAKFKETLSPVLAKHAQLDTKKNYMNRF